MAEIRAFHGLRYNTDVVGDISSVTTPPYDIISKNQQEAYYKAHPFNVIRLELGMEQEGDTDENNKYSRAGEILNEWVESGVLQFDDKESMYVYGQDFTLKDGRELSYKGIVCLVKLEEFEKGIVLPHEETLSKAKSDRFNLMSTTCSNFSAIYSLYLDEKKSVTPIIDDVSKDKPEISFKTPDGVTQKLWSITDNEQLDKIKSGFANKQLFIADGHHRYETALNFRNSLRAATPNYTGDELFNYVMMFLVEMDEPGLVVFPTYRLLLNFSSFDEAQVIDALNDNFEITKVSIKVDAADEIEKTLAKLSDHKVFAMYTGHDYFYQLKLKSMAPQIDALPNKSSAYQGLDVSILHTLILDRVFGIDSENMKNQKNMVYTRDPKEAENGVKEGLYQCAFFLNPTKIHEIKEVSLANEKMPQKSTYFYPKLITGLVMNKFE